MKILLVRCWPGRLELSKITYNYQEIGLAKALNRLGHTCDLVMFGGCTSTIIQWPYTESKSFTIHLLKGMNIVKNAVYPGLSRMIKQYDFVQIGEYDQLQTFLLAGMCSQKMVVYHGPYFSEFNRGYNLKCRVVEPFFLPRFRKQHTTFMTKSTLATQYLKAKGLCDVHTLGVGIDVEAFQVDQPTAFSLKLETLRQHNRLLLYIGCIEPRRNILFLLDVLKTTKQTQSNIKLVIVGSGDSKYVAQCMAYAKKIGVFEDIVHQPVLEQRYLRAVYKQCDIFLLPTLYDIFGMVILEAMYLGLPMISSVNGGSVTLINDGENGYVLDTFNAKRWAQKVDMLLQNPETARNIGIAAHKTIVNHYTWDALAKRFIDIYQQKLLDEIIVCEEPMGSA